MIPTIQTTFRGMSPDDSIESIVRDEAAKLERFFDRITSCRVVVAKPHRHKRQGSHYQVSIIVNVPGKELVTNSSPNDHAMLVGSETDRESKSVEFEAFKKNPELAIRDAFRKSARQLQDYVRKLTSEFEHVDAASVASLGSKRSTSEPPS